MIPANLREIKPGFLIPTMKPEGAQKKISGQGLSLEEKAAEFVGEISQVPPMYSAVKVNGKRLYEYARQGRTVERKARTITIYELEITKIDLPLVTMRVRCSKGTYIRTLCHDLGQELGTGAAMEHLLRTRVGQFRLENAIRLDDAENIMKSDDPARIEGYILPVDSFFEEAPKARVRAEGMKYLRNGNALKRSYTDLARETKAGDVRMYDEDGKFYALYRYDPALDELKNVRMFLT